MLENGTSRPIRLAEIPTVDIRRTAIPPPEPCMQQDAQCVVAMQWA